MKDNRAEVYSVLNALGYNVDFQYPKKFTTFPTISYFDSGHSADDYFDGRNKIDIVETTIDVWEREDLKTGVTTEIHSQVDKAMRQAGFIRTMYTNLFETDTKILHHVFKFIKPYEEEL